MRKNLQQRGTPSVCLLQTDDKVFFVPAFSEEMDIQQHTDAAVKVDTAETKNEICVVIQVPEKPERINASVDFRAVFLCVKAHTRRKVNIVSNDNVELILQIYN